MELCNQYTVLVRNLVKYYEKDKPVLNNLSMSVRKGTIYGLLGASGSGKSTLLNCLIGISKWNSGQVLVFGKSPGSNGSEIAASRLGYMPQDLALYGHLTILETIQYYGRLFGLNDETLQENWRAINALLVLPQKFTQIQRLSGGQKRRISMALALISKPNLAILDEPTVGLDPVLRCSIWEYLQKLVSSTGATIIITTHYTEEAKFSDTIGFMRNGKLLVENSPSDLLNEYKCSLLEDVMKSLCYEDEFPQNFNQLEKNYETILYEQSSLKADNLRVSRFCTEMFKFCRRVYGFCTVLFLLLLRFPAFSVLALLTPVIQGSLTLTVLGSGINNLQFGIVNNELDDWPTQCASLVYISESCDLTALSCNYINELQKNDILLPNYYSSEEEALQSVHEGKSWGYLTFPANYTQHSLDLMTARLFAVNESIEGSRIHVNLDYSNKMATFFMIKHLHNSFLKFTHDLAKDCNICSEHLELGIQFRKPVYGLADDDYFLSALPGLMFYSISAIISTLSCLEFVADLKNGTLMRARIAGLGTIELLTSYLITNGFVVLFQILIYIPVLYFLFRIEIYDCTLEYLVFCMLCGFYGILIGIFFGMITKDEITSITLGSFVAATILILGGALFPREYQSNLVHGLTNFLPITIPSEGLASVIVRKSVLFHPLVWPGLLVNIVWIVGLVFGSVILMPLLLK